MNGLAVGFGVPDEKAIERMVDRMRHRGAGYPRDAQGGPRSDGPEIPRR